MSSFEKVGTISANGEREIGELIAKAMERVGKEGVITIAVSIFHPPHHGYAHHLLDYLTCKIGGHLLFWAS